MGNRLEDKVAVVTGSSSGNGRAVALALAREGAAAVCSDTRKSAREGGHEPHPSDPASQSSGRLPRGVASVEHLHRPGHHLGVVGGEGEVSTLLPMKEVFA